MAATSGAPLNAELLRASKIIPDVVDEVCEPFLDMRVIYRKKIGSLDLDGEIWGILPDELVDTVIR